ncbi:hypothetical protein B7P43_G10240 [Cryptotermes secundus]|uniref:DDE-1 domain-containing protein n=1 Tax=Cryptotermes secundus TaxID=105785 RepID=A0A2J7PVL5_9NEOP|nr:hypothetical protein B7P43_G10240 [Cryptotermes secundus]
MWRSNNKAWVTRDLFTDWINEVFGPSVKKYLLEMNLPLHVLLVMDNAPAHPPDLQDDLLEEFKFIKIQFLPPNTTPLLQPMDQQVISNFKKLYTKALFEHCFEVTEGTNLTLKRVLEISLPHRCLPQDDRKGVGRGYQEDPHFCLEEALAGECWRM